MNEGKLEKEERKVPKHSNHKKSKTYTESVSARTQKSDPASPALICFEKERNIVKFLLLFVEVSFSSSYGDIVSFGRIDDDSIDDFGFDIETKILQKEKENEIK